MFSWEPAARVAGQEVARAGKCNRPASPAAITHATIAALGLEMLPALKEMDGWRPLPYLSEGCLSQVAEGQRKQYARQNSAVRADATLSSPRLTADEGGHVSNFLIHEDLLSKVRDDLQLTKILILQRGALLDDASPATVGEVQRISTSPRGHIARKVQSLNIEGCQAVDEGVEHIDIQARDRAAHMHTQACTSGHANRGYSTLVEARPTPQPVMFGPRTVETHLKPIQF